MLRGREKELNWLDVELERGPVVCLLGAPGVGKTHLLRSWPKPRNCKVQWVLHHPYRSFLETLNATFETQYKSLEGLLSGLCGGWEGKLIIWDNLHLLPASVLGVLLGHLQIFSGKHILVSRGPLPLAGWYPKLELLPLEHREGRPTGFAPTPQLDPAEQNWVWALQIIARPVELAFLQKHFPLGPSKINTLVDRGLIEKQENYVNLSGGGEGQDIPKASLLTLRKKVWSLLEQDPGSSLLEKLIHALTLDEKELSEHVLAKCSGLVDAMDGYGAKLLGIFILSAREVTAPSPLLIHLLARAYFILGQRHEGLSLLQNFFSSYSGKWDQAIEDLGVEYAQFLVRQERFLQAREFIDQNFAHLSAQGKRLFSIEKAVSLLNSSTQTEQLEGEKILTTLLKELSSSTEEASLWPKAQASFQLARAYYHLGKLKEARLHFVPASMIFKRLSRPYFSAICDFNLAWIALRSGEFLELTSLIQHLKKTTSLYGYAILNAGLELLEAKQLRLGLKLDQALILLESALKRLGDSAPPMVVSDILMEKARVLEQMGLFRLAQETLEEIEKCFKGRPPTYELKALRIKLQCHHLSLEEGRDMWASLEEESNEDLLKEQYLLMIGDEVQVPAAFVSLPAIKLALGVQKLLQALKLQDEENIWRILAELDAILSITATPLLERAALRLLEATLAKSEQEVSSLLSQAKLDLARSQADEEHKGPLEAWWHALENKSRPQESLKFKKSLLGPRERWQLWWSILKQDDDELFVISKEGRRPAKDISKLKKGPGLLILDDRHEIWFEGQLQTALLGRHQLRKILSLLMESYPAPLKKEELATMMWGESYNPLTHDVRIYTATSRLRELLADNIILNTSDGYVFNGEYNFRLVKAARPGMERDRLETIIMETLLAFHKNGQDWVGRKELKQSIGATDSSLKRALSKLLSKQWILRQGQGAAVKYTARAS